MITQEQINSIQYAINVLEDLEPYDESLYSFNSDRNLDVAIMNLRNILQSQIEGE